MAPLIACSPREGAATAASGGNLPENGVQCGQYAKDDDRPNDKSRFDPEHRVVNLDTVSIVLRPRFDQGDGNHDQYHRNEIYGHAVQEREVGKCPVCPGRKEFQHR